MNSPTTPFSIRQQQYQSNLNSSFNSSSNSSNPDSNVVKSNKNSTNTSPIAGNNINVSITNDINIICHETTTTLLLLLISTFYFFVFT
jgi:hypothetical protein